MCDYISNDNSSRPRSADLITLDTITTVAPDEREWRDF